VRPSYVTLSVRGRNDRLYLGVSSTLAHRGKLVWYEEFPGRPKAARREADIKRWARGCKIALIERLNPGWTDLSSG
jgi:predicted GIY-YIG superfamily endonuclease